MPRETMSDLQQQKYAGENDARVMLASLEGVLVNLGYTKSGTYRGRFGSELIWDGQHLYTERGTGVDEMTGRELIFAAENLPYLLDILENNTRWEIKRIREAIALIDRAIEDLQADPQPPKDPS